MKRVLIQFDDEDVLTIDHTTFSSIQVNSNKTVFASLDGTDWVQIYPSLPEYNEEEEECFHTFDDHPTVCSECGEIIDRSHEIDFMEDSD